MIFVVTTHQKTEGRFQADLGLEICEFFGSRRYGCDYQNCHEWVCNSTNLAKWLIIIDVQERQEFFFWCLKGIFTLLHGTGQQKRFRPHSSPILKPISLLHFTPANSSPSKHIFALIFGLLITLYINLFCTLKDNKDVIRHHFYIASRKAGLTFGVIHNQFL